MSAHQLGSLVVGIDVGGTNTDAALVFTPSRRTADGSEVVELLESWVDALAAAGRSEEAREMESQLRRRRAMMQWQDHTGEWRHANLRAIVCAWVKRSTTADITSGVAAAILAVTGSIWAPSEVSAVLIGTTHFVNAIVQRSAELAPVAVLRLCGSATQALPPFVSLPADLARIVQGHYHLASGGLELDGQREIGPLDKDEIAQFVGDCIDKDLHCIVVCGVFAPVNATQEQRAVEMIQTELEARLGHRLAQGYAITASSEVAGMGLLERESAAILNACVQPLAQRTVQGFKQSLQELQLSCPLYLTQNDGTVASVATTERLPIGTFSSGPTNSMRGAAFVSGMAPALISSSFRPHLLNRMLMLYQLNLNMVLYDTELVWTSSCMGTGRMDAVVVDVGGTTTDVGLLVSGFPRQAGLLAEIGGVQTNYAIPDTVSVGLGGGSLLRTNAVATTDGITLGPDSVGHRLTTDSLSFGGSTATSTDVAVVMGVMDYADETWRGIVHGPGGDAARAALPIEVARKAWAEMQRKFEQLVDMARLSAEPLPVILVGGGAILVGDTLDGASELVRPVQGGAANAIGAAIAQTSGTVDRVFTFSDAEGRKKAFAMAEEEARRACLAAGATRESVRQRGAVMERSETPLPYMAPDAHRIRIRVVGELDLSSKSTNATVHTAKSFAQPKAAGKAQRAKAATDSDENYERVMLPIPVQARAACVESSLPSELQLDERSTSRTVVAANGDWLLCASDIDAIALGVGILAAGGGGNASRPALAIRTYMQEHPGTELRVRGLGCLSDDEVILSGTTMGAPLVAVEKLMTDKLRVAGEAMSAARAVAADALLCLEIGGGNGMEVLYWSLLSGIPALDAASSKAFPEVQFGTPALVCDEKGNRITIDAAASLQSVADFARSAVSTMGSSAAFVPVPIGAAECRRVAVPNAYSQAWRLGRTVLAAQQAQTDPVAAIIEAENGRVLFVGKVIDVTRTAADSLVFGDALIEEIQENTGPGSRRDESPSLCKLHFQNEFLMCELLPDAIGTSGGVLALVPDLICAVESETGRAIGSEELKYGQRCSIVAIPCSPLLTTESSLEVVGPKAFGLSGQVYEPGKVGEYKTPLPAFNAPSRL